jgi:3-oxoacyl-[acyl-carrier protein] reductase
MMTHSPGESPSTQTEQMTRSVLVLGGSGAGGSEVVRGLRAAAVEVVLTYCEGEDVAEALALETGARTARVDLRDAGALPALVERLRGEGVRFTGLVHAAGVAGPAALADVSDEVLEAMWAVNTRAAVAGCRLVLPDMIEAGGGEVVLFNALDRAQSLPLPPAFAATQGALSALAMAMGRAHGGQGVRVNVVAVGLLERGLSEGLDPALVEDYKNFSALRRLGVPVEAARVAVWLITQNSYMNGKVIPVNGGI